LGYFLWLISDEDPVLAVDRADRRLERHQGFDPPGPVAGLLLQLTDCRLLRPLVPVDQPARQFPSPPVDDAPVPPQPEHSLLVVDQEHDRGPAQPHDVMPEAVTAGDLDVDLAQPYPGIVVDGPLAERPPSAEPLFGIGGHGPDARTWGTILGWSLIRRTSCGAAMTRPRPPMTANTRVRPNTRTGSASCGRPLRRAVRCSTWAAAADFRSR